MCKKCKYDTSKFIEDSKKKYGNLYGYDKVEYITNVKKVELFCNDCGKYFSITPQLHFNNGCCPNCNDGFYTKTHMSIEDHQNKINAADKNFRVLRIFFENNITWLILKCENSSHSEFKCRYKPKSNYRCDCCFKQNVNHDNNSFIKKAQTIYGDRYDYSEVNYEKNNIKVKIFCKSHGEFFYQTPSKHLCCAGCPQCIKLKRMNCKRFTLDEFVTRAKQIHNDKYSYDKVVYKKNSVPVNIFCKIHNEYFWQTPMNHLSGSGCRKCGIQRTINYRKITMDEFIERSNNIHNNKYEYNKVVQWVKDTDKVVIICPIHGEFSQPWYRHMCGHGCSKCSKINFSKGERKIHNYLKTNNVSFKQQVKMDGCKYKHHL